jgi:Tfp pilus assembly protein PilO
VTAPPGPPWRRRALLALLAILALNAVAFAAYTLPRTMRVRSATVRAGEARAEVEQARQEVADLRGRADALKANAADAERFFTTVLVPRAEALSVVEDVERMAREPGLKPGTRGFSTEASDRLLRIKVTLPLEGSYAQLVAFLQRVERSKHFLTVDRIGLSGDTEGAANLHVELSAYFRSEGRPLARR